MTPLKYPVGYLGLGFGQRMAFSHMVVLWENDDGTTTLSQRYTESHEMPQFIAQPPRKAWLPDVKPADWHPHANSSMTFEVQRTHGQLQSISEDPLLTTFIWAFSYFRPGSASPETDIRQHYIAGSLRLDLNKELDPVVAASPPVTSIDTAGPPEPYTLHEMLVLGHGILLSLGFLVLLPVGSLAARWTRTITPTWFKVHRVSNYLLGLPVILIGWLLGPIAVFDAQASHFLDTHQICGLVLFGLYLLQILLGRYIHARNHSANRPAKPHPPSNILHACYGLTIIALAFLQVRSGMKKWERVSGRPHVHWPQVLLQVWAIVLPVAYFLGLSLLKRQFYQENQGLGPAGGAKHYISLASPPHNSPLTSNADFEIGDDHDDDLDDRETKEVERKALLSAQR
ncbi:hypothetical protein AAF712_001450 [Marasmius tenuissimus]|uniref:Cytochrome b561 domain-containing protein n=1 Tax=Marasmius tenuissimus TaxID=585030 RepID=A0ABR3ACZ9_9AGAR